MMNTPAIVFVNGIAFIVAYGLVYYLMNEAREKLLPQPNNRSSILLANGPPVQFVLYTRDRAAGPPEYLYVGDDPSLSRSSYNVANPLKVVVHGFLSSVDEDMFDTVRSAYLRHSELNIVGVDWSRLCSRDYVSAVKGARSAAERLGALLSWLEGHGVCLEGVHLIGHSLGAHVAGLAAETLSGRARSRIGRITGLDPAGPGFNEAPAFARLDASDAVVVDVIHTSMRVLALAHPLGHVDFYPNGGRAQPGCPDLLSNPRESVSCNHGRAYALLVESISNKGAFKAHKCSSLDDAIVCRCLEESDVYMGQPESYKNGLYYVKTKGTRPFSYT